MKILHLYHDIMNLYGDYANITAMRKLAVHNGVDVTVDKRSLGDEVTLGDYDFIFIGSGTERNMKVVLEDMRRYKGAFADCIGSGKVILMTGNAFEMLGRRITDADGKEYEGLGLLNLETTEQNRSRLVGDVVFDAPFLNSPIVGFINKCSEIRGCKEPLFTVGMGLGNADGDKGEGVRMNNLFCTHVTGPVLVKNPHFLTYLYTLITGRQADDSCLRYEKKGYSVTLNALQKRMAELSSGGKNA